MSNVTQYKGFTVTPIMSTKKKRDGTIVPVVAIYHAELPAWVSRGRPKPVVIEQRSLLKLKSQIKKWWNANSTKYLKGGK